MFFAILLIATTLLVALVTGLVFTFAVVVMPGLGRLPDAAFVRGFQVVDGVIQDGSPPFMLAWLGSAVALVAAAIWGLWVLDMPGRVLLGGAAVLYVLGLQVPTVAINVPMNNVLQKVDANDAEQVTAARQAFEGRWNRWNLARTIVSVIVLVLLAVVLVRL